MLCFVLLGFFISTEEVVAEELGWRFVSGSQSSYYACSLGTSDFPGSRYGSISFSSDLYDEGFVGVFGGYGCGLSSNEDDQTRDGYLNDMWISRDALEWDFVHFREENRSDNRFFNQPSTVRDIALSSGSNFPGGRCGSSSLQYSDESSPNLKVVIFGGYGTQLVEELVESPDGDDDDDDDNDTYIEVLKFGYLQDLWILEFEDSVEEDLLQIKSEEVTAQFEVVNGSGSYTQFRKWKNDIYPSCRSHSVLWIDESNEKIISFGGIGVESLLLNDLVIMDVVSRMGMWQNPEAITSNSNGIIVNQNEFDEGNSPGGRYGMIYWKNRDIGYFYGGFGFTTDYFGQNPSHLFEIWEIKLDSYEMKRISDHYSMTYTNNEEELVATFSFDLWPIAFLSSASFHEHSELLYFYGGKTSQNGFLSDLWSIDVNHKNFHYYRFASSSRTNETIIPGLPDVLPSYEGGTPYFSAVVGGNSDGNFLGSSGYYFGGVSVGEDKKKIISDVVWYLSTYYYECGGIDSSNSSVCSGVEDSRCEMDGSCFCPHVNGIHWNGICEEVIEDYVDGGDDVEEEEEPNYGEDETSSSSFAMIPTSIFSVFAGLVFAFLFLFCCLFCCFSFLFLLLFILIVSVLITIVVFNQLGKDGREKKSSYQQLIYSLVQKISDLGSRLIQPLFGLETQFEIETGKSIEEHRRDLERESRKRESLAVYKQLEENGEISIKEE